MASRRWRRIDGVELDAIDATPKRLQEVTLSSTVVGLVAALDHDDDAAVAAADHCFSFSEPSQRIISTV